MLSRSTTRKTDLGPVSKPAEPTHVVVAAWHCHPCDVQGRSVVAAGVECWNCGGSVIITAQPSVPIADFEQVAYGPVPRQRTPIEDVPDFS